MEQKKILVTGDVIVDHHIYAGERDMPNAEFSKIGSQIRTTDGGAGLVYELLSRVGQKVSESHQSYSVHFGFLNTVFQNLPLCLHAFTLWRPFIHEGEKQVWRVDKLLGYGNQCRTFFPISTYFNADSAPGANIILLDDAGLGFRHGTQKEAWPHALTVKNDASVKWIILKMSHPIAQGDLWRLLCKHFGDKLITVISISDIRHEQVKISKGISWECTALDLAEELCFNTAVRSLLSSRHLIINFGSEGAMHVESHANNTRFRLIYDPAHLEGEWGHHLQGQGLGFMACFCAGISDRLLQPQGTDLFFDGIAAGLSAMRIMNLEGHGPVNIDNPQFPYDAVGDTIISPKDRYSVVDMPNPALETEKVYKGWTILAGKAMVTQKTRQPLYGVARRIALLGAQAHEQVPFVKFGGFVTIDRTEIESLRHIRNLIYHYQKSDGSQKPLSLAVFGQPGSGKSYAIVQIAHGVLGDRAPVLEFNLSQFEGPEDLIGAFHQVRDKVLLGTTPVVFWDEFDCNDLHWMQYMLAPMQDGVFQDGQITHPIGKCLFVFAGGVYHTMEQFSPKQEDSGAFDKFRKLKGPDFISRLGGFLNVLGPNPAKEPGNQDIFYPVRRALLIRTMLKLKKDERLQIDRGILSALLEIKEYTHGARSLDKILSYLKRPNNHAVKRSDLPPTIFLSLHTDAEEFIRIVNRDLAFMIHADQLAPYVHAFYRELGEKEGWLKDRPDMNKEFDDLSDEYKQDNLAAAARIPQVLDIVGLSIVPSNCNCSDTEEEIKEIIENNIELLAEAEHNGWMDNKLRNGWLYDQVRNEDHKAQDSLLPYALLLETNKNKDRNSVRRYPEILKKVGYKIVSHPV